MVIRIVKMTFRRGEEENFLHVFNEYKDRIRGARGCLYLEVLKDIHANNVYLTYSKWESETHLNNYRDGEVFTQLWPKARRLFAAPAQAWTIQSLEVFP